MTCNGKAGPHPLLQSQRGEVREVQFEVQRFCPDAYAEAVDRRPVHFPFAVWVYWPPETRKDHPCGETQIVYRLSPRGRQQLQALFGYSVNRGASACEHMGRIIE
jgi:hypothetical protein